jgi:predicted nucleic acid-binding protein
LITAIDSNILFDILVQDQEFAVPSEQALETALASGAVVISEPVLAELAARFPDEGALREFLTTARIRLEPSTMRSLHAAGIAWTQYSRNRPEGFICSACGTQQRPLCSVCERHLSSRQHVLSDFLIGAHAMLQAEQLLTRDRGYFRTYFPDLKLI